MSCVTHCAALRFLSSARMSRLLKLTLVGEVTVSQSVSVVAIKISSEVRPHPTNAKDSVTSTLKKSEEAMHLDRRFGHPFKTSFESAGFQVFCEQPHSL